MYSTCSVWENHTVACPELLLPSEGCYHFRWFIKRHVPGKLNTESLGALVVVCRCVEFPSFVLFFSINCPIFFLFYGKIPIFPFIWPLSLLDTVS